MLYRHASETAIADVDCFGVFQIQGTFFLALVLLRSTLGIFQMQSDDPCRKMLVFLATQDAVDFHYYLLDHMVNGRASDSDDEDHQRRKRKRFQKTEDEDGLAVNVQIYRLHGNMSQQVSCGLSHLFRCVNASVSFRSEQQFTKNFRHRKRLFC